MPQPPPDPKEELKRLWQARHHALQQIHAGEETFRAMPTWTKAQSLANRRHELHLIELDIVSIDDEIEEIAREQREQRKRENEMRQALRALPRIP